MKTKYHQFDLSNADEWELRAALWHWADDDRLAPYLVDALIDLNKKTREDIHFVDHVQASMWAEPGGRYDIKHTCDHCGAHFNYGAIYRNVKTNENVVVGHICATHKLSLPASEYADRLMRESAAKARDKLRSDDRYYKLSSFRKGLLHCDHYITKNMKRRFEKDGYLTLRQWELARKLAMEEYRRYPTRYPYD